MPRPDPRGRALLRAYRSAKAPPGERHDALWSRIEASLDQGALGPSLEPESSPAPGPLRESRWMVPAAAAVVAVAALVIAALTLGPAESRGTTPRRAPSQAPHEVSPREPTVVMPTDAPSAAATSKPLQRSASVPEPEPSPASPRRRPARPSGHDALSPASDPSLEPSPSSAAEVDELRAEMALIRTARQALQAGRPARALEVLDAHARAFPAGQMREDRQVLRIEALCAAGKAPQARAEVSLFLRAFPGSAHAQRVRASCAER
jgi:hypothetical protein